MPITIFIPFAPIIIYTYERKLNTFYVESICSSKFCDNKGAPFCSLPEILEMIDIRYTKIMALSFDKSFNF